LTFLIISSAFFALGNVLLVNRLRKSRLGENSSKEQPKPRRYPAFILIAAYWLLWFFLRKN